MIISATRKIKNRHSMVDPVAKDRASVRNRITKIGQRILISFNPGKREYLSLPAPLDYRSGMAPGTGVAASISAIKARLSLPCDCPEEDTSERWAKAGSARHLISS